MLTVPSAEMLRVEIECRREEEDIDMDMDLETASQKSMAKVVNRLWNQDQLEQLEQWGVLDKGDSKLSRADLAHKISVLDGLERKASVLMGGQHPVLPAHMEMEEIKEELRSRRIHTRGDRAVSEPVCTRSTHIHLPHFLALRTRVSGALRVFFLSPSPPSPPPSFTDSGVHAMF